MRRWTADGSHSRASSSRCDQGHVAHAASPPHAHVLGPARATGGETSCSRSTAWPTVHAAGMQRMTASAAIPQGRAAWEPATVQEERAWGPPWSGETGSRGEGCDTGRSTSTAARATATRRAAVAAAGLLLAPWAAAAIGAGAGAAAAAEAAVASATASGEAGGAAALSSSRTQQVQQAYDAYAPSYDDLDDGALSDLLGFDDLRKQLLSGARGAVLEVAVGTGLNLRFYDLAKVRSLTAIDLSQGMLDQARTRAARQLPPTLPLTFLQADATSLPLPDASFDCVVDTFSLCVIPDPEAALREMARLVRPGIGRVLLLEHTRSDNPLLAAYQDATAEAVAATSKGCFWNQDVAGMMARAGLTVARVERHTGGTVALFEGYVRG